MTRVYPSFHGGGRPPSRAQAIFALCSHHVLVDPTFGPEGANPSPHHPKPPRQHHPHPEHLLAQLCPALGTALPTTSATTEQPASMGSMAADREQGEETAVQIRATGNRRRAPGDKQQCLLGAERPPTRKARRIMSQGPATLPRALADLPLIRRRGPFPPIESGHTRGPQRIARLTALLPVGATPAKPRALERQVWLALERRCLMEAEELRALGFSDKADTWIAELHSRRAKRQQGVQERASTYRANEFERSTLAAQHWLLGKRMLDQLSGQPRS